MKAEGIQKSVVEEVEFLESLFFEGKIKFRKGFSEVDRIQIFQKIIEDILVEFESHRFEIASDFVDGKVFRGRLQEEFYELFEQKGIFYPVSFHDVVIEHDIEILLEHPYFRVFLEIDDLRKSSPFDELSLKGERFCPIFGRVEIERFSFERQEFLEREGKKLIAYASASQRGRYLLREKLGVASGDEDVLHAVVIDSPYEFFPAVYVLYFIEEKIHVFEYFLVVQLQVSIDEHS